MGKPCWPRHPRVTSSGAWHRGKVSVMPKRPSRRDETIARAIKGCEVMVCLWSTCFAESEWCVREVVLADNIGKPIVPLHRSVGRSRFVWKDRWLWN